MTALVQEPWCTLINAITTVTLSLYQHRVAWAQRQQENGAGNCEQGNTHKLQTAHLTKCHFIVLLKKRQGKCAFIWVTLFAGKVPEGLKYATLSSARAQKEHPSLVATMVIELGMEIVKELNKPTN